MTFNGERLRLLRQFHDLTQTELGGRVAVSQATIADYERDKKEPSLEVLHALASALRVEPKFFDSLGDDSFQEDEYNFRRKLSATERLKKKVAAQASLLAIIAKQLGKHVEMPAFNFPAFTVTSLEEIEAVAEATREHWGLGLEGPIHSMTRVLEHAGAITVSADEDTAEKVDAFSRYGDVSIVVLNWRKGSGSRSFFDAAHEAAHGVLHRTGAPITLERKEEEADRFAGAFLMPRKPFTRDWWSGGGMEWENLLALKRRWGTSIQAIVVRAYQIGLMDAAAYRQAFKDLSRRGWRTVEPEEPAPESPELFATSLERLKSDCGLTPRRFAEEMHISSSLFYSLTGVAVADGAQGITSISDYLQRQRAEIS